MISLSEVISERAFVSSPTEAVSAPIAGRRNDVVAFSSSLNVSGFTSPLIAWSLATLVSMLSSHFLRRLSSFFFVSLQYFLRAALLEDSPSSQNL